MKVLLTAASLDLSDGGPSENIPKLADALSRLGTKVGVVSAFDGSFHSIFDKGEVKLFVPPVGLGRLGRYPKFVSGVVRDFGADIIHDNGIWLPQNHVVCGAAIKANKKLLIGVRGMLEPWPLRYKATKKKIAWSLFQKRNLMRAHKLIATADEERRNILGLLPGADVAIVPNGWDVPDNIADFFEDKSESRPRKVLFFSRIHPQKGIELLIEAWDTLGPKAWHLDLVGPGDNAYVYSLKRKADDLGLTANVRILPPVYGNKEKNEVLGAADVVVLPSYSENFGSVVVEAMGLGVPVITTTGTPWSEIAESKAGWWVAPSVEGIRQALTEAIGLSDAERQAMGRRGREIVMAKYTWESVAKRMLEVYEQTLAA